jgi:hypothetical protein
MGMSLPVVAEHFPDGKDHVMVEFCNVHFYARMKCGLEWRGIAPVYISFREYLGTIHPRSPWSPPQCEKCFHEHCTQHEPIKGKLIEKKKGGYEFL